DPEIEKLFTNPILQKADEQGEVISTAEAAPPLPAIVIPVKRDSAPIDHQEAPGTAKDESRAEETPEPGIDRPETPRKGDADPALDMPLDQLALLTIQKGPTTAEGVALSIPEPDASENVARQFLETRSRAAKLAYTRSPRLAREILRDFFAPEPIGPIEFSELRAVAGQDGSDLPLRLFVAVMADGSERLLPVIAMPGGELKVDVPAFTRHTPVTLEMMLADPARAGQCEFRVYIERDNSPDNDSSAMETEEAGETFRVKLSNPDWSGGPLFAGIRYDSE
ncbi:MAG: hypothetical protein GWO24_33470, partial [Akkermansiaceae bacterium]|nr:hypothetical protein [Akkermansiaceae bacterium]